MLVLSRHPGEEVVITLPDGRRILVRHIETVHRTNKVRLGITADPDIIIHRREIQDEIDREVSRRPLTEPIRQLPENPERTL